MNPYESTQQEEDEFMKRMKGERIVQGREVYDIFMRFVIYSGVLFNERHGGIPVYGDKGTGFAMSTDEGNIYKFIQGEYGYLVIQKNNEKPEVVKRMQYRKYLGIAMWFETIDDTEINITIYEEEIEIEAELVIQIQHINERRDVIREEMNEDINDIQCQVEGAPSEIYMN